ncbi:MAG TPA: PEP-CTERM sorting domain-containing protein [Bryobacteraceae bacterium]|jgi:hypothetical protein
MQPKTLRLLVLTVLGWAALAPQARANLVLDLNTGGTAEVCGVLCGTNGTTLGWSFQLLSPITVNGIGIWDASSAPLGTLIDAGLWTSTGTILAAAVISDGSTPVASASANGRWLFQKFPAVTLNPGTYLIGNVFYPTVPLGQANAPFTTIPQVLSSSVVGAEGTLNGALTAPLNPFVRPIFGPTLETAAVPEPGLAGVLGLGLTAVFFRLKKRRAQ